jgi:hypothetical protein
MFNVLMQKVMANRTNNVAPQGATNGAAGAGAAQSVSNNSVAVEVTVTVTDVRLFQKDNGRTDIRFGIAESVPNLVRQDDGSNVVEETNAVHMDAAYFSAASASVSKALKYLLTAKGSATMSTAMLFAKLTLRRQYIAADGLNVLRDYFNNEVVAIRLEPMSLQLAWPELQMAQIELLCKMR